MCSYFDIVTTTACDYSWRQNAKRWRRLGTVWQVTLQWSNKKCTRRKKRCEGEVHTRLWWVCNKVVYIPRLIVYSSKHHDATVDTANRKYFAKLMWSSRSTLTWRWQHRAVKLLILRCQPSFIDIISHTNMIIITRTGYKAAIVKYTWRSCNASNCVIVNYFSNYSN